MIILLDQIEISLSIGRAQTKQHSGFKLFNPEGIEKNIVTRKKFSEVTEYLSLTYYHPFTANESQHFKESGIYIKQF